MGHNLVPSGYFTVRHGKWFSTYITRYQISIDIDGLPIKNGYFFMANCECHNQMVMITFAKFTFSSKNWTILRSIKNSFLPLAMVTIANPPSIAGRSPTLLRPDSNLQREDSPPLPDVHQVLQSLSGGESPWLIISCDNYRVILSLDI